MYQRTKLKSAVAFFFLFFLHGISFETRQQGISYNLEIESITIHPPIGGIETIKREKMNRLKTQKESTLHSVLCAGVEYKTKFKVGDRVKKDCYVNVMVIDGVDEVSTSILNQLHWSVTDEDYLLGKTKTSMAEIVSDDEIRHCL